MKIVAVSDLQGHPWQESQRADRVQDCVEAIHRTFNYAESESADMVVFIGDLYEAKRAVRTDVFAPIYAALFSRVARFNGEFRAVPGNHDWYKGRCTLEPFDALPNARVVLSAPIVEGDMVYVGYRSPFTKELMDYDWRIAFTHHDIAGARVNSSGAYACDTDGPPKSFRKQEGRREFIFNGHFHHPQTVTGNGLVPVVCIGAPLQHNWGDKDDPEPRGCTHINLYSGSPVDWFRIPFDGFPRFFSKPDHAGPNDFVQVSLSADLVIGEALTHEDAHEVAVDATDEAVVAYVGRFGFPPAQAERLVALGRSFLSPESGAGQ